MFHQLQNHFPSNNNGRQGTPHSRVIVAIWKANLIKEKFSVIDLQLHTTWSVCDNMIDKGGGCNLWDKWLPTW